MWCVYTIRQLLLQASESLTDCAKGTSSCQEQGLRKYGSCRRQLKGTESEIRHHGPLNLRHGSSSILNHYMECFE